MQSTEFIVGPDEGEQLLNLGSHVNIKVSAEATGGAFAVIEHTVPPQGGPPPHTHGEAELLYILSGQFEVVVGSAQLEAGPGTVIHVPPGIPHTTRNVGQRAGRQLSVYVPGGSEGFFREAGAPVTGPQDLPDLDEPADLTGVDMPRILALANKYGMNVTLTPSASS